MGVHTSVVNSLQQYVMSVRTCVYTLRLPAVPLGALLPGCSCVSFVLLLPTNVWLYTAV